MPDNQKSGDEIVAEGRAAYKAAGGGQYSKAPYSMVRSATASPAPAAKPAETGIKQEAHDTGTAIAFRLKQQKLVNDK